jgi:hypothetical protein
MGQFISQLIGKLNGTVFISSNRLLVVRQMWSCNGPPKEWGRARIPARPRCALHRTCPPALIEREARAVLAVAQRLQNSQVDGVFHRPHRAIAQYRLERARVRRAEEVHRDLRRLIGRRPAAVVQRPVVLPRLQPAEADPTWPGRGSNRPRSDGSLTRTGPATAPRRPGSTTGCTATGSTSRAIATSAVSSIGTGRTSPPCWITPPSASRCSVSWPRSTGPSWRRSCGSSGGRRGKPSSATSAGSARSSRTRSSGWRRAAATSGEDDAEPVAELDQVRRIDRPVAVEIQIRQVVRIRGNGPEGAAESGQVQDVDHPVAVHVAEEAVQAGDVFPACQPAGDGGVRNAQRVVAVDERRRRGRTFGQPEKVSRAIVWVAVEPEKSMVSVTSPVGAPGVGINGVSSVFSPPRGATKNELTPFMLPRRLIGFAAGTARSGDRDTKQPRSHGAPGSNAHPLSKCFQISS